MEALLGTQTVNLLTSFTLMAVAMSCMLLQKKRVSIAEQRQARKKKKEEGTVNIGAIFGMDVGGTLTKIVYFEAQRADSGSGGNVMKGSGKTNLIQRTSSDSLAQLDCPDHQAALENFYTFMDNNKGAGRSAVVRDEALSLYSKFLHGKLHFLHFETRNMIDAINYVSSAAPINDIRSMGCTGGGAHKFAKEIEEELEITTNKFDELECLVRGMHFALNNFQDECFTYRPDLTEEPCPSPVPTQRASSVGPTSSTSASSSASAGAGVGPQPSPSPPRSRPSSQGHHNQDHIIHTIVEEPPTSASASAGASATSEPTPQPSVKSAASSKRDSKEYTRRVVLPNSPAFPYLVVNIGSGVSILKVTGPGKAERVSGTSLGGGTYWGLCRLLTNCSTYEEVLDFAERGDANSVDMLVKDIYGGDYGGTLSGSMVASSFGKLVTKEHPREGVREEDLALALLMMITNNIGQVAYLTAQLQKCSKIFFVGNFLRQNPISCRRLAFAISFWSQGKMEAMFLVHEGHFGALGTFLTSAFGDEVDRIININNTKYSDKVAVRVESGNGNAGNGSGDHRRSRSAGTMQAMIDQRPQPSTTVYDENGTTISGEVAAEHSGAPSVTYGTYFDTQVESPSVFSLRNLRGRSFSEDCTYSRSNSSTKASTTGTMGVGGKSTPTSAARASATANLSVGSGSGSPTIGTAKTGAIFPEISES